MLQRSLRMAVNPARVLIVDDDSASAELLALLIERRGHQVRIAYDVDEGLSVAHEFKPNVALLDIMIRLESGYFLAREIRAVPELAHCRLVAVTGFTQERLREASDAAGFHRHLTKPIDPAQLFHAIETPEDYG